MFPLGNSLYCGDHKMTFLYVLLGLLLIQVSDGSQDTKIDFSDFCTHFNDLRTSPDNMTPITKDFIAMTDQLREEGKTTDVDAILEGKCADRSAYFDDMCLYARRFNIIQRNHDWRALSVLGDEEVLDTYVDLWLLHPLLRQCLDQVNKPLTENDAKTTLFKGLTGPKAEKFAQVLTPDDRRRHSKSLRHEIKTFCGTTDDLGRQFCQALPDIVALVDAFKNVKDESKKGVKWNAFQLYFVVVKDSNPEVFEDDIYPSPQESNEIIVKNLEQIFKYMSNGQMPKMEELLDFIPGLKVIRPACRNLWNLQSREKNACLFWKAIIQIRAYIQSLKPNKHGLITKILNTKTDYPEFLKLTEMNRVLEVVENNANALPDLAEWVKTEVNKNTNERFKGLRTYFQKVETFNRMKSKADVDFVKSRLDFYRNDVNTITNDLASRFDKILDTAISAVTTDIAEDTYLMSLSLIAVANPLTSIIGGGSVSASIEKAQTLAQSLAKIAKLKKMGDTFDVVQSKVRDIGRRFGLNSVFLQTVKELIESVDTGIAMSVDTFEAKKQKFLDCYKCFDPQVKRPELAELTAMWEALIDSGCNVIESTHGAGSAIAKTYAGAEGHCPKAKVLAAKMTETYTEIYDFQFELIEAMATNMRAMTSQYAALDIVSEYEGLSTSDNNVVNDFKTLSLVSFISYKINMWQITESYCDILEYKDGGNRPDVCQGRDTDIATLASYDSTSCRNTEAYKDIPISSTNDEGFMNLNDLYAGRPVTFKIPDSQWLVTNGWISTQNKDSSIVVKKFEVYLPSQSLTQRMVRVDASVVGDNKPSTSSDTSYVIVPNDPLIYEYLEGNSDNPCKSQPLPNPYGSSLPKLCPLNVDENNCLELLQKTPLFPSVFSRWKITVSGYESTPVPSISNNDFSLKVGMKLCILDQSAKDKASKRKKLLNRIGRIENERKQHSRQSCHKNRYWSRKARRCVKCPKGSRSALDGYFCEKRKKN